MMSSKRSVALPGVVDEGLVEVSSPQATQNGSEDEYQEAANRMINSRYYLT